MGRTPKPPTAGAAPVAGAALIAVVLAGCGRTEHGASLAAPGGSAAAAAAGYAVRRESLVAGGERTVVLARAPELGELSVRVSEPVTAAEARELASFLLTRYGVPYASRLRSIAAAGPERWTVVVEAEPPVALDGRPVHLIPLGDPSDHHVSIARTDGTLEITGSELVVRP